MRKRKILLFTIPILFLCFSPFYLGEVLEPRDGLLLLFYWTFVFLYFVLFFLFEFFFFATARGALRASEISFYSLALFIFNLHELETRNNPDHYFYSRTNEFIFVYVIIIVLYFIFFRLLDKNPKSV